MKYISLDLFKFRIRIKMINWIQTWIRINLQMTSHNAWKMGFLEHFFKVLSLYLEARIRIRIRICIIVRGMIRIRIKMKNKIRIRIRFEVTNRIRIRIGSAPR
jgi:hypothetical protein